MFILSFTSSLVFVVTPYLRPFSHASHSTYNLGFDKACLQSPRSFILRNHRFTMTESVLSFSSGMIPKFSFVFLLCWLGWYSSGAGSPNSRILLCSRQISQAQPTVSVHFSAESSLMPIVGYCGRRNLDQSVENPELKCFPFKAWSGSEYKHACVTYCQGFLPWTVFCLPGQFTFIFPPEPRSFSCVLSLSLISVSVSRFPPFHCRLSLTLVLQGFSDDVLFSRFYIHLYTYIHTSSVC